MRRRSLLASVVKDLDQDAVSKTVVVLNCAEELKRLTAAAKSN